MDPPDHSELRNLMNVQFKPRAVLETEPHMRKIVGETLDRLASRSQCDFVDDVSAPVSLRILTNLLGVRRRIHTLDPGVRKVVLDLSDVEFVDHTFLIRVEGMADEWQGAKLEIVGIDEHGAASEHPHASRRRLR